MTDPGIRALRIIEQHESPVHVIIDHVDHCEVVERLNAAMLDDGVVREFVFPQDERLRVVAKVSGYLDCEGFVKKLNAEIVSVKYGRHELDFTQIDYDLIEGMIKKCSRKNSWK